MCFCSSESMAYTSLSIASFSSNKLGKSLGTFNNLLKKSTHTFFFKYLKGKQQPVIVCAVISSKKLTSAASA